MSDQPPAEFWERLKAEFSASPKYAGYDPDEDVGYFLEWLVGRLYEFEQRQKAVR